MTNFLYLKDKSKNILKIKKLFFVWPGLMACEILVPQPGTEPGPSSAKGQSPNHWTAREFHPLTRFFF